MRIAFTSKGTNWDSMMDPRFGRTEYLLIYDEEKSELTHFDNRAIENEAHGAGPKTAQKLFELKADVLITGNGPGDNAAKILDSTKIRIYTGAGNLTIKKAFDAYKTNSLNQF
ncbi:MAG: NifB/NifX family molybdenum-iron cluster-binding protein [Bacteroidales bacterium]|nr:NifB/NifX family molybdenum-iron cluster-binding protein [Bacteroidales bacterium]